MGFSETYIKILKHSTVDATIEFIKKFKSSKSYWSVSYFILVFTIREAIAWKFGSAIKTFCETQAVDSSFATLWSVIGFVLEVGGSVELVLLGTFIFVVLSLVNVAEQEGTSISVRENYLTMFLIVFVGSVSLYQNDEMKGIVKEIHEDVKKIKEDDSLNRYLVKELTEKEIELNKYIKALKRISKDANPSLESINKTLKEEGVDKALISAKAYLNYFENQIRDATVGKKIIIKEEKIHYKEKNESTWIKPSNSTCVNNGGEIDANSCEAKWEDALAICYENGGSLPSINALRKVVRDCGGTIDDYENNQNNSTYTSCYNEKGFNSRWYYWSNTANSSSSAWSVHFRHSDDYWNDKTSTGYVLCVSGQ